MDKFYAIIDPADARTRYSMQAEPTVGYISDRPGRPKRILPPVGHPARAAVLKQHRLRNEQAVLKASIKVANEQYAAARVSYLMQKYRSEKKAKYAAESTSSTAPAYQVTTAELIDAYAAANLPMPAYERLASLADAARAVSVKPEALQRRINQLSELDLMAGRYRGYDALRLQVLEEIASGMIPE